MMLGIMRRQDLTRLGQHTVIKNFTVAILRKHRKLRFVMTTCLPAVIYVQYGYTLIPDHKWM
jgi:hypothetical protein